MENDLVNETDGIRKDIRDIETHNHNNLAPGTQIALCPNLETDDIELIHDITMDAHMFITHTLYGTPIELQMKIWKQVVKTHEFIRDVCNDYVDAKVDSKDPKIRYYLSRLMFMFVHITLTRSKKTKMLGKVYTADSICDYNAGIPRDGYMSFMTSLMGHTPYSQCVAFSAYLCEVAHYSKVKGIAGCLTHAHILTAILSQEPLCTPVVWVDPTTYEIALGSVMDSADREAATKACDIVVDPAEGVAFLNYLDERRKTSHHFMSTLYTELVTTYPKTLSVFLSKKSPIWKAGTACEPLSGALAIISHIRNLWEHEYVSNALDRILSFIKMKCGVPKESISLKWLYSYIHMLRSDTYSISNMTIDQQRQMNHILRYMLSIGRSATNLFAYLLDTTEIQAQSRVALKIYETLVDKKALTSPRNPQCRVGTTDMDVRGVYDTWLQLQISTTQLVFDVSETDQRKSWDTTVDFFTNLRNMCNEFADTHITKQDHDQVDRMKYYVSRILFVIIFTILFHETRTNHTKKEPLPQYASLLFMGISLRKISNSIRSFPSHLGTVAHYAKIDGVYTCTSEHNYEGQAITISEYPGVDVSGARCKPIYITDYNYEMYINSGYTSPETVEYASIKYASDKLRDKFDGTKLGITASHFDLVKIPLGKTISSEAMRRDLDCTPVPPLSFLIRSLCPEVDTCDIHLRFKGTVNSTLSKLIGMACVKYDPHPGTSPPDLNEIKQYFNSLVEIKTFAEVRLSNFKTKDGRVERALHNCMKYYGDASMGLFKTILHVDRVERANNYTRRDASGIQL